MQPQGDEHNGQGKSRLDRLEGLMELLITDHLKLVDEHRQLLTAQVLLTDSHVRLTDAQTRTEKKIQELTEAQKHTDERLNALIAVVDDLVHKRPAS